MAAATARIGAAIVTLRRTARSCAAPRACQAAHRSSNVGVVDGAAVSAAASCVVGRNTSTGKVSTGMTPPQQGFREGWAGMAEGSEKQRLKYTRIGRWRPDKMSPSHPSLMLEWLDRIVSRDNDMRAGRLQCLQLPLCSSQVPPAAVLDVASPRRRFSAVLLARTRV